MTPRVNDRAAEFDLVAEELQQRRLGFDVLAADRLVGRIEIFGGDVDLPGAQRHDEGRQLHLGDQPAVDEAAQRATGKAAEDRNGNRDSVAEGELPHDHGGEHHDGADREVDAGGEDDQRLGRADNADDGDLLQDQGQRERIEELAADQNAEYGNRQDEHDERHGRLA